MTTQTATSEIVPTTASANLHSSVAYTSYESTKSFSKLAVDYVKQDEKLQPFYLHTPNMEGIKAAIAARQKFANHRALLVDELRKQYAAGLSDQQEANLQSLLSNNTFTITTAHQPNILTGPLYFIYKILHAIKLADSLKAELPGYDFVPVYYMGSEDADLDELGHIYVNGEKLRWDTNQQGAVGRMNTKGIEKIIQRLAGEFGGQPFGQEMTDLLVNAYTKANNIQQATFQLVNELFKAYGLLILIPDNANLKRAFEPVVKKELLEQFSHQKVAETIAALDDHYKVQAAGRELNLFYLDEQGRRERIEMLMDVAGNKTYEVKALELQFSEAGILEELDQHPERFSANVILRGVFQETILPNIVFIGGGGELAYWMELKKVFEAVNVPYPMLVLRNSFLIIEEKQKQLKDKLALTDADLFKDELSLINDLLKSSGKKLDTTEEQVAIYQLYEKLQLAANAIDTTLKPHIAALHVSTLKGLKALEKKMLRAERKKQSDQQRQLVGLKKALFPNGNLQERTENFMPYYAKYGPQLMEALYQHSLGLEQEFVIMEITG